jgi:glutathione S-transferase
MADVIFYTNPRSRGQIARWALHEAGADYEQRLLGFGTTMKSEEYLAINPMGKVPAIVRGDAVVTEAAAICAYLADAYPDAGLVPDENERANYYRWLFYAAGPVEQAVTSNSMGFKPTPEQQGMMGFGNYDLVVDVLDGKFARDDYVCGGRFTLADVYVGAQVGWGLQFGSLPRRDSFAAYAGRVQARDAYKAAKEIDTKLIAEAEAVKKG